MRRRTFREFISSTRVYLVTDDAIPHDQMIEVVSAALEAGVRLVQYRDKHESDAARVRTASDLTSRVHSHGGLLIVNDRVDIALAAGADGVHLGQDDLPFDLGRRLLGPDLLLGVSASYLEELDPPLLTGVDYLGFGAVYPTATKPDAEYAGLALLAEACSRCQLPVVGIGGIHQGNARAVITAGADGVAVVSAVSRAADPLSAARALLQALA